MSKEVKNAILIGMKVNDLIKASDELMNEFIRQNVDIDTLRHADDKEVKLLHMTMDFCDKCFELAQSQADQLDQMASRLELMEYKLNEILDNVTSKD